MARNLKAAWCARFAEVLRVIDANVSQIEAERVARISYPSASVMDPIEAVWVYVGLNERRQRPRNAAANDAR